ncbi:MAG: hypothetical protein K9G26_09990 [Emcibacter sp.]|nr:hypothetical protein [Emcibacter sp.]
MIFSWQKFSVALLLMTVISSEAWAHAEGPLGKIIGLAEKYRNILLAFKNSSPSLDVEFERFSVEDVMMPKWIQSKKRLNEAIDEAIKVYDHLIDTEFR